MLHSSYYTASEVFWNFVDVSRVPRHGRTFIQSLSMWRDTRKWKYFCHDSNLRISLSSIRTHDNVRIVCSIVIMLIHIGWKGIKYTSSSCFPIKYVRCTLWLTGISSTAYSHTCVYVLLIYLGMISLRFSHQILTQTNCIYGAVVNSYRFILSLRIDITVQILFFSSIFIGTSLRLVPMKRVTFSMWRAIIQAFLHSNDHFTTWYYHIMNFHRDITIINYYTQKAYNK